MIIMIEIKNKYLFRLNLMRKRLVKYWKFLKNNSSLLEIYKENQCINRYNEMCLYNSRDYIQKAIIELERVIVDIDKK